MAEQTDIQKDLQLLAADLKRLEGEYNMFFSGRLPRPPWETRGRVEAMVKRYDRGVSMGTGDRFRFEMLQSRFQSLVELWDRGIRSREEGRAGPFAQPLPKAVPKAAKPAGGKVVSVTAFTDPVREMDKLHSLYDSLMDARRQHGEDVVPFHKFAALVKNQVIEAARPGDTGGRVPRRGQGREGRVYRTADEGNEERKIRKSRRSDAGELETGTPCGIPVSCGNLAGLRYVASLLALGAIDDLELDRLTFLERPEAIALDGREVDEYVRPAFAFNETVTLGVVEPLDLTCDTHRPFPALRSRGAWRRMNPSPATAHFDGSGRGHKKRPRVRGLDLR